mmetsp:Transcript_44490/g.71109  ORF Transcript_44490/g.71109 Transcript_44490/m.71109 type:complete len:370 (-) Transcript_44490:31-1140(-)
MEGTSIISSSDGAAADVGQANKLKLLIARKRECLRTVQEEKRTKEEKSTETWSGLRISDRCVRPEKVDQSMRGKSIIRFDHISAADPVGRDQVFMGVMTSVAIGPKSGPDGKEYAEWILTDLDLRCPQKITLVLVGRALEHWSHRDGPGRKIATVGSIMAVLNPTITGRAKVIRISFESQLLKLGMCPSLVFCKAKNADGLECREPFNSESGCDYCMRHESVSHGARQHHRAPPSSTRLTSRPAAISQPVVQTASRPVASPLASANEARPSGVLLTNLQRAEAALDSEAASGKNAGKLRILKELESMQVDAVTLRQSKMYDKIGSLVQGHDAVSSAAKVLRRRWRVVLDDVTPTTEEVGIHVAKRQRLG